jgi:hypothetical protein
MFVGKARPGAALLGKLLALPTNIRPGWKGLPGSKYSSLLQKMKITDVKSFKNLRPCGSGQSIDVCVEEMGERASYNLE